MAGHTQGSDSRRVAVLSRSALVPCGSPLHRHIPRQPQTQSNPRYRDLDPSTPAQAIPTPTLPLSSSTPSHAPGPRHVHLHSQASRPVRQGCGKTRPPDRLQQPVQDAQGVAAQLCRAVAPAAAALREEVQAPSVPGAPLGPLGQGRPSAAVCHDNRCVRPVAG